MDDEAVRVLRGVKDLLADDNWMGCFETVEAYRDAVIQYVDNEIHLQVRDAEATP